MKPGESIYEAANRKQIRLPVSCKNGVCHICKGKLLSGQVEDCLTADCTEALKGSEREIMLCRSSPLRDCEIEIENVYARGELPVKEVVCQIVGVTQLQGHIYQAKLSLSAGKIPEFFAGQYLSLHLPGSSAGSYFSIASAPGNRELELHIQADPHLDSPVEIIEYLKSANTVTVSLPYGKACILEEPEKGLVLIAAGTGFAQMKSILEGLLSSGFAKPVTLYWGVRREQDMYQRELPLQWERENSNFSFVPLISEDQDLDGIDHHDHLVDTVLKDHSDFSDKQVFVSGSPNLVFSAMDRFEKAGMNSANFFSDVLEYMERPTNRE